MSADHAEAVRKSPIERTPQANVCGRVVVQKAVATRARLEADARSSQREAAELMQGHTNVARSLLAEELRLLDDEWREEA